jgi:hypothetical protein
MPRHKCLDERVGINAASGEGAVGRSARRLMSENLREWRVLLQFRNASPQESSAKVGGAGLGMSRLRGCHRPATIVVTASRIAHRKPRRIRHSAVAGMCSLAHAAGMRLPSRRGQRHRDEIPRDGKQQQKSRSQAIHRLRRRREPTPASASIDQNLTKTQAVAVGEFLLEFTDRTRKRIAKGQVLALASCTLVPLAVKPALTSSPPASG